MGKDKKTPILIDDQEYFVEDMDEQAKTIVNHIADLDRKLSQLQFNEDQLKVGRQAFIDMLKALLTKED